MALKITIGFYHLFFLIILQVINGFEGQKGFEDLDIDQQLKILNKPYIKSIKIEGDTFDCVNITKQPAFDHPSLKGHEIQMNPSSSLKDMVPATSPSTKKYVGIKITDCPFQTVPIRRTLKEDLVRLKTFMKSARMKNVHPNIARPPGFHYATLILRSIPSKRYFGGQATINIQNPSVKNGQLSEAFMRIQGGTADSIQTGWMVNPTLQGDNLTRLFSFWTSGKSGCFDMLCPGFIQVDKEISLSTAFRNISVYGGQQFDFNFLVFQDVESRNWWLKVGDRHIGYWPKSLFTYLSGSSVTEVLWGGGAFSIPKANVTSPAMGNGHFAEEGFKKAAYVQSIRIVDEFNTLRPPDTRLMQLFSDNPSCYTIRPFMDAFRFLYGGPGGNCGL